LTSSLLLRVMTLKQSLNMEVSSHVSAKVKGIDLHHDKSSNSSYLFSIEVQVTLNHLHLPPSSPQKDFQIIRNERAGGSFHVKWSNELTRPLSDFDENWCRRSYLKTMVCHVFLRGKNITEFTRQWVLGFFFILMSVFRKYLETYKLWKCAISFYRKGVLPRLFQYNIGYKLSLRIWGDFKILMSP